MAGKTKRELKGEGMDLKPTVHIGKGGLTDRVVEEVKNQVKKNKLVKVRVLSTGPQEKSHIAEELASRAGVKLIEVRGNTVLLCDEKVYAAKGGTP
ncbi:MAG TPA: YhbY family RNA-binding protein [Methanomassiliicoccales archaeon]|nr:YhbY family RNA-binding protein [Methanomassiliicoccales archaeon]